MGGRTQPKPVIGIVGGIGSGKSTVAQAMAQRGAVVLDADRIGHEVLRRPPIIQAARQHWGEGILGEDGQIDRRRVAGIVFGDSDGAGSEKAFLEGLVHPLIAEELRRGVQEAEANPEARAVVIDAALLMEAGWNAVCDVVIFVDASSEQRAQRVAASRGWTVAEMTARERQQESLTSKRARADVVVDNSGPAAETYRQVERIFTRIVDHTPDTTRGPSHTESTR